ncbi:unnamed protein product [Ectocarpus sp. 12 AP-2014]
MRAWMLLLLSVLLAFGAHGQVNGPANATPEDKCCSALLVEGEAGSLDAFGKYRLPTPCGGEPAVACPKLGFNAAAMHDDAMTASWLAFQQQSGLRAAESCPPTEWEDRCPPGATMLLAEKRRGGCRAAGCIAVGGELKTSLCGFAMLCLTQNNEDDEWKILRAVTAQQTGFLQAAKPTMPKTFYQHVAGQQRAYAKASKIDEKRFTRKLVKAMKSSPPSDIELVRALVDEATTKGFRSAATDEATKAVTKHDDQQSAIAIFRSLPGAFVRQVAKASLVVTRHSNKQRKTILALQLTNHKVLSTAASDNGRSARTERDLLAKLDIAEDTIASLTDTVAEQQLAAAMESERFDQTLRQLDSELKTSRQAARAELEFCERDLAEVDSASVSLSLFTAEKSQHGNLLAPKTCPVTQVAALGMHDRSAAHQAAQWTCARLDAVRRMVDASTSRWEDDKATCQVQEAEARDREVQLNRLLDAGEEMRKDLEDDLALSEEELDETQTAADSCAADFEEISSRSVDLVRTLQEDAAKTTVHVGGLASAALEVEDRDGSDYDMIRARLEAVQRLVLTATSMLEAEILTCQGEKADAGDREDEIEERRQELEDELAVCEQELDETQTAADSCAADFEDISSRSVDLVRTLQEDAAKTAVHVGGLAPVAKDRDGSDYDIIRARLEAVQRLVLTATSTLEEEIFTCEGEKADAVDREGKIDENMRKLNEDLSDCANYADGSHRAWVSCTEGLTSVDRVSLDTYFSVEEIAFQVGVFVPRRAASDLEASNIFSIANRADRVEETQREVLDRLRSRFEDMQEMTAAVVSNLRSCTCAAPGDSGEASEGKGSVSVSDSSGDVNDTGVDTGEDSTASAGDGTAVDRTEADDAGNEEDVGGQEPDAHVIDANPPTLDGV